MFTTFAAPLLVFLAEVTLSLNLSFDSIWPIVNQIVPAMWVVFSIPLGIRFAFGILDKILTAVERAFSR